jgi:filamentous hemagglutinin family protein
MSPQPHRKQIPTRRPDRLTQARFKPRPIVVALTLGLFGSPSVRALPTDPQVEAGNATVTQPAAGSMNVNQTSDRAIINWGSFSIANGEKVQFNQPSATAVALNRVLGLDPTSIYGQLLSNGRIFLINPNGIVFGRDARVDVGGLVASTLSLKSDDFLSGNYRLTNDGKAGAIVNEGRINAPGGTVVLAAPQVTNAGTITADGGKIGLVAADDLLVDVEGDGLVLFRVNAGTAAPKLEQLGTLQADGGEVALMARARGAFADTVLNLEGVVRARTLASRGGQIVIDGGDAGATLIAGSIDATAPDSGQGGRIVATGGNVSIASGARIDASGGGDGAGGTILLGGGQHGTDASVANASTLALADGATISANGGDRGDGGTIVAWADRSLYQAATLTARGGTVAGNGGFIETSTGGGFNILQAPDASATAGRAGQWLLDPGDIDIVTTTTLPTNYNATPPGNPNSFTSTDNTQIAVSTIVSALKNNDVVVKTGSTGSGTGTITLSNTFDYTALTTVRTLTLSAASNIILNAGVSGTTGLSLTLTAGTADSGSTVSTIAFNTASAINLGSGSLIANKPVLLQGASTSITANSGIQFLSTVDGSASGKTLTLGSSGGNIQFGAAVGGTTPLAGLAATSLGAITAGAITTTNGDVNLNGSTNLGGNVATNGGNFTVTGGTALVNSLSITTGAGTVSFNGQVTGGKTLTVSSSGNINFGGPVGTSIDPLTGLSTTGNSTTLGTLWANGPVKITGSATLGGTINTNNAPFEVTGSTTLGSTVQINAGSGTVTFDNTVDGAQQLTVDSTGATTFGGAVGGGQALTGLSKTSAGTTALGAVTTSGNVTLTGQTTLNGAINTNGGSFKVVNTTLLGGDTTVNAGSGDVTFGDTLNGAHQLAVTSNGTTTFTGAIGSTVGQEITQLTKAGTGSTSLAAVTTKGNIDLTGTTTLNGTVTTNSGTLTVNGPATLNGAVFTGGGGLALNGSATLNNSTVNTSGGKVSVTGPTTLGADVAIDAGSGSAGFNSTIDGAHALVVTSSTTTTFMGPIGSTAALASLTTNGGGTTHFQIGGTIYPSVASVRTTGSQTYGDLVLDQSTYLQSAAGVISYATLTLASGSGLAVSSGLIGCDSITGSMNAGGTAGNCLNLLGDTTLATVAPLTFGSTVSGAFNLQLNSAQAVSFNGPLNVSTFRQTGAGATTLANVTTSGIVDIAGPATLNGTVTTSGGALSIGGEATVNGAINTNGGALTLGKAALNNNTIDTLGGPVSISGATTLGNDVIINAGIGDVVFNSTIDGVHALVVTSSGLTTFKGAVGSDDAGILTSLVTNGGGTTHFQIGGTLYPSIASVRTSGSQSYDDLVLDQSAYLKSIGGTISYPSVTLTPGSGLAVSSPLFGCDRLTGSLNAGGSVSACVSLTGDTTLTALAPLSFSSTVTGPFGLGLAGAQAIQFANALNVATLHQTGVGTLTLANVTTTGDIDITGPATLNGTTTTNGGGLTINAPATVNGAINTNGGAVSLNGPATLGSTIDTLGGLVSIVGPTTLSNDVAIVANGGNVSFGSTVDGTHALSVSSTGTTTFAGAVGASQALTRLTKSGSGSTTLAAVTTTGDIAIGGPATLNGAIDSNNGALAIAGAATLGNNVTVDAGSGNVSFGGTVNGAHQLAITSSGTTTFTGAIGNLSGQALTQLTKSGTGGTVLAAVTTTGSVAISGPATLNGSITTGNGALTIGSAATLGNDVAIDAGSGNVSFGGTVNGAHGLAIASTGTTTFTAAIGGISGQALTQLAKSGAGSTSLAAVTTTGDIVVGGAATLHGAVSTGGGALSIAGATTLGNDVAIDVGSGNAGFGGTVDGAHQLSLNSTGTTSFSAAIGGIAGLELTGLTKSGAGATTLGALATNGNVSIAGPATLGGAISTHGGNLSLAAPTTLGADVSVDAGSGTATFGGALDGNHVLTLASSGGTVFAAPVGANAALAGLTQTGNGAVSLGALNTSGAVSLKGPTTLAGAITTTNADVRLAGSTTLAADVTIQTGTGNLDFATVDGAHALNVASSGATTFHSAIGSAVALASLTQTGNGTTTLAATTTTGTINLSGPAKLGGNVHTNGGDLGIAGATTLANDVTVDAGSGNTTFGGSVDGAHALTIASVGATTFSAAIGQTTALTRLTQTGSGAITLAAVTTTGTFSLAGPALLGGNIATHGGNASIAGPATLGADVAIDAGSGNLTFGNTVDGAHALTVSAAGGTLFDGAIGSTTALTSLTQTGSGATRIGNLTTTGAVSLSGPVTLGGSIQTNGGAFDAAGATQLAADTSIATGAGNLVFGGTVDGAHALALASNGVVSFGGPVGATTALASFTQTGSGAISLGNIKTTGAVSLAGPASLGGAITTNNADVVLSGPTTLTADTTIDTGSGAQNFGGTLDGAHALTLVTTGNATFGGAVGATTPLKSLDATAGDAIFIAGGSVQTTQGQHYRSALVLNANTSLQSIGGGDILFDNTVDASNSASLKVLTAGTTRFGAAVGSNGRLGSLYTDNASGADATHATGEKTVFAFAATDGTPSVQTTGDQTYLDPVEATGRLRLDAGNGQIAIANTANKLSAASPDGIDLTAASVTLREGGDLALGKVTLQNGGDIVADGVVKLIGNLALQGGELGITSNATPGELAIGHYSDADLDAEAAKKGIPSFLFSAAALRERTATIEQNAGSTITTSAGSLLHVHSPNGGSILLDSTSNDMRGELSVTTGVPDPTRFNPANTAPIPVSEVRIFSTEINVAGSPLDTTSTDRLGIDADIVKVTAARLDTGADGVIRARLPYLDVQGTTTSIPGITFNVLPPAFAENGFGTSNQTTWIRVLVGDSTTGGFVSVRPKGGYQPSFAIFTAGPQNTVPFYDGTNQLTEIQVYYNGVIPQSPSLVGAITSVLGVAEDARREKVEEAVRTENVAPRLRSGVIVEVGPGRPATEDREGTQRPELCEPAGDSLSCQ